MQSPKVWLPELRAAIELKRGHPMQAVELLAPVAAYEAGWFDSFLAAYLRGLAYLDANHGQDASTEFQKILDHRGIVIGNMVFKEDRSAGSADALGMEQIFDRDGNPMKRAAVIPSGDLLFGLARLLEC